jgi:dTDP-4-dehydrorhamnose reductase
VAAPSHEVWGCYRRNAVALPQGGQAIALDLLSAPEVARQLAAIRPDVIVHCAAMTDVDACEADPMAAWSQNTHCTRALAQIARQLRAELIYISTDFVFDGAAGNYEEVDIPAPINTYGHTKLEGERAALEDYPDSLVLRTCIFGQRPVAPAGLPQRVFDALADGRRPSAYTDQFFTPILADDLSAIILELAGRGSAGLYHVAGRTRCSKFEFVGRMLEALGANPDLAVPTSMADSVTRAPRPRDASLRCTRVEALLGHPVPDLDSGIRRLVAAQPAMVV